MNHLIATFAEAAAWTAPSDSSPFSGGSHFNAISLIADVAEPSALESLPFTDEPSAPDTDPMPCCD